MDDRKKNSRIFLLVFTWTLISRLTIHAMAYFGYILLENQTLPLLNSIWTFWYRWDTPHYLFIAENWYVPSGEEQVFIVFFPLYPIALRFLGMLIGDYYISGILISNISLVIALYFLYKLIEIDFEEDIALHSVKYVLIFPVSFFMSIVYTESLYLLLVVLTFYYLRKNIWFLAGIFGFLASLTRNMGVLLMVPAIIEYVVSVNGIKSKKSIDFKSALKRLRWQWVYILLIPSGTLIYIIINKSVTGDWFAFIEYQKDHWSQNFGLIWENMKMLFVNALTWEPRDRLVLWGSQIVVFWALVVIILLYSKKLRCSYLVYAGVSIFFAYSPTWLLSGPRYLSVVFPIYIVLALASRKKTADFTISLLCILFLVLFVLAFTRGYNLM